MKDHPILISENFDAAVALCARHTTTAQRFTNLPHAAAFHVPICKGTFFTARQHHTEHSPSKITFFACNSARTVLYYKKSFLFSHHNRVLHYEIEIEYRRSEYVKYNREYNLYNTVCHRRVSNPPGGRFIGDCVADCRAALQLEQKGLNRFKFVCAMICRGKL
jgi:hypothetical protein